MGIDPGAVSAAYAILLNGKPVSVDDVPVVDRMVDGVGWGQIVAQTATDIAIIEQVGTMPKQGVTSSFRFGMGVGLLRGAIHAAQVPLIQTPPTKWKRHYRLDSDKEKARALALRLFPSMGARLIRKKDHGRAEALLIANYLWETRANDL